MREQEMNPMKRYSIYSVVCEYIVVIKRPKVQNVIYILFLGQNKN